MQLEAQNQDLREELSTMRGNHEKLEKRKCQLEEEVANLKQRLEANMVDYSQIQQYQREMEERAEQEIRQKLQEVNLFLQMQAASQNSLEEIRASHHASLRNQLKDRIRDLERELDRIKNTQQDSMFQKVSTQAEVERYKELYLEEVKIRRCLANKLERYGGNWMKKSLENFNRPLLNLKLDLLELLPWHLLMVLQKSSMWTRIPFAGQYRTSHWYISTALVSRMLETRVERCDVNGHAELLAGLQW
ncbi:ankyrin repeat domain-containing protein 26-like isoform 1-T1 [Theristicus caerulescens]